MGGMVFHMNDFEAPDQGTYLLAEEYGLSPEDVNRAARAIASTPDFPVELAIDGHPVSGVTLRVAREFDTAAFMSPRQAILEIVADNMRMAIVVDRNQLSDQLMKEL